MKIGERHKDKNLESKDMGAAITGVAGGEGEGEGGGVWDTTCERAREEEIWHKTTS